MIEQSIEIGGRPNQPAYITLRKKYGAHRAGCKRREILTRRAKKGMLALPNKRPSQAALTELSMSVSELDVASKKVRDNKKYRDSTDEVEHRLGMRLPRR